MGIAFAIVVLTCNENMSHSNVILTQDLRVIVSDVEMSDTMDNVMTKACARARRDAFVNRGI